MKGRHPINGRYPTNGACWDLFALSMRGVMALVWLYNGLWLKLVTRDLHHARIVESVFPDPAAASLVLTAIGCAETALALAILSGRASRVVNLGQVGLLVAMNGVGIAFSVEIARPIGLVISNLPLVACAFAIAVFGPGRWVAPPAAQRE